MYVFQKHTKKAFNVLIWGVLSPAAPEGGVDANRSKGTSNRPAPQQQVDLEFLCVSCLSTFFAAQTEDVITSQERTPMTCVSL